MSALRKPANELDVDFVDAARGAEILDEQARKHLNMSGPEFVRRYKAGDLVEFDGDTVFRVSILLPFVGESFERRDER